MPGPRLCYATHQRATSAHCKRGGLPPSLAPLVRHPSTPPRRGRACPAPTGWRGRVADERGKGGRQPAPFAVGGGCPLMSGIAKSRAGHARPLRTAVSGNGGSGALGGAQRAPPVCFANTLVRLFAPQGQTLLAPQFRCAQLWPRARNPATPDSKVEEGAGALRTKSNTAFV